MITLQHTEEGLSMAYLEAVSARAGVNLAPSRAFNSGFDGTFHQVGMFQKRRQESERFDARFPLRRAAAAGRAPQRRGM